MGKKAATKTVKAAAKATKATTSKKSTAAPDSASTSAKAPARKDCRILTGNDDTDFEKCKALAATSSQFQGYYEPVKLPDHERGPPDEKGRQAMVVRYKCKECGEHTVDLPVNLSTGANLKRHRETCLIKQEARKTALKLTEFGFKGSEAPHAEILQQWAIKCCTNGRPFQLCQDKELKPLLSQAARDKNFVPTTVARAVTELAALGREVLAKELEKSIGVCYVLLDGWASPNHYSIVGLLIKWRRALLDGSIQSLTMPLNFVPLNDAHTGPKMAELLRNQLERFKIEKKTAGIAADNASNMANMTSRLTDYHRLDGEKTYIRCFLHIINLVVKAMLKSFDLQPRASKSKGAPKKGVPLADQVLTSEENEEALNVPPTDDTEGADLHGMLDELSALDEADLEKQLSELEEKNPAAREADEYSDDEEAKAHSFRAESATDTFNTYSCQRALGKLQLLAIKLTYSPHAKAIFREYCKDVNAPTPHNLPRKVKTRWGSEYEQMKLALDLQAAIEKLQDDSRVAWPLANRLTKQEFTLFKSLTIVLAPAHQFTKMFSVKGSPLIADVVLTYDKMTQQMDKFLYDDATVPALHNAILRGYKILQKYYGKTDNTFFYRAAILLHPSLGEEYMRVAGWEEEWIEQAYIDVQLYYYLHYGVRAVLSEDDDLEVVGDIDEDDLTPAERMLREANTKESTSTTATPATVDNIIRYYAQLPRSYAKGKGGVVRWNPVEYWRQEQLTGRCNGNLVDEFALDIFECPASTVDVERTFSLGRRVVGQFQHNLSPNMVADIMTVAFLAKNKIIKPGMLSHARSLAEAKAKAERRAAKDAEQTRLAVEKLAVAAAAALEASGPSTEGDEADGAHSGEEEEQDGDEEEDEDEDEEDEEEEEEEEVEVEVSAPAAPKRKTSTAAKAPAKKKQKK